MSIVVATLYQPAVMAADCGGVETAIDFNCGGGDGPVSSLIIGIINAMIPVVGIVIVIVIVIAGIMISTARGNQAQVNKGLDYIRNAIIGLVLFIFMQAILRFVVPGV